MARIPTVTRQVSPLSLRTSQGGANTRASGDDFGAQIGRAVQGVGQELQGVSNELYTMQERKRREQAANLTAGFDFTPTELAVRQSAPADGSGLHDSTLTAFDNAVNDYVNSIEDDAIRQDVRDRLMSQRPNVSSRSIQTQFQLDATDSQLQANTALNGLYNSIRSNPDQYTFDVERGVEVINSRADIPAAIRAEMVVKYRQQAAASHIEGRLEAAKTVEDIDSVVAEMTGQATSQNPNDTPVNWQEEIAESEFSRLLNGAQAARKAITTANDASARAAIDTLEKRNNDPTSLIPQEELTAVAGVVAQSDNPITQAKFARIMRDQQIMLETRRLPSTEQNAMINQQVGMPGGVYPGVPPTINEAINSTVGQFDVSAGYLGATLVREYGQHFNNGAATPTYDTKFTPLAVHNGVDLRNIRPDVVNAAGIAGQLFGAPLPITSGYRSQAKQDGIRFSGDPNRPTVAKNSNHTAGDAIDVSTTGMSEADKARLVGALVDAGFTGIGEYGTHIHGDFRSAVPSSYAPGWGGWTKLSAGVQAELDKRGYGAGVQSNAITRAAIAARSMDDIDYGQGTSIVGADGQPTSGAVGVGQFVPDTWLGLMKDPVTARRIGVDTTGMSDEQILELRKDPTLATRGVAALAEQNKRQMSQALGRSISDPELYAGHFLGAAGGVALIRAYETQPDASAAALLPKSAEANKPVFYNQDGTPKTVREVMNGITRTFSTAPSQVQHGDIETRRRVAQQTAQMEKNDPILLAQQTGSLAVPSLQDGFAARGQAAQAVANYYNIPVADMKPFTADEAASLSKQISEGSSDDVLALMTQIQAMGGDMSRAAFKQIGQEEPVFAFAAGLAGQRGEQQVASNIVRGQKRLEENPNIEQSIGATKQELNDYFTQTVGGSLQGIAPRDLQAIQDAAKAHYVETYVARNGGNGFDQNAWNASVQAVLGGKQGAPAIDTVNGEPTVVPPGMTGQQVEQALDRMTVDDWTRLSVTGEPPRYSNGSIIDPQDLADEARLRAIGGNKYQVLLSDNTYAITGNTAANGRLELYIMDGNPEALTDIANRADAPRVETSLPYTVPGQDGAAGVPQNEIDRLYGGALWNFDEYGRWKGPVQQ